MRLVLLSENAYDVLNTTVVFTTTNWWDFDAYPDATEHDMIGEMERQFSRDPPPGISPIPVKVRAVRIATDEEVEDLGFDGAIYLNIEMSVEDFIRNSVEYDSGDPYNILEEIKVATRGNQEILQAAWKFMNDPDIEFRVAGISGSEEGLSADNRPTKLDL